MIRYSNEHLHETVLCSDIAKKHCYYIVRVHINGTEKSRVVGACDKFSKAVEVAHDYGEEMSSKIDDGDFDPFVAVNDDTGDQSPGATVYRGDDVAAKIYITTMDLSEYTIH